LIPDRKCIFTKRNFKFYRLFGFIFCIHDQINIAAVNTMKTITTVLKWRQESIVLLRFSCRVQCLCRRLVDRLTTTLRHLNRTFLWRLGTYLKTNIRPKTLRKTKNKYSRVYSDVHITAKPTDYCQNKGLLWPTLANCWDLIMRNRTRCEKIKGEVSVAIEVVIRFDRHQL
jgi:hypothetical protein